MYLLMSNSSAMLNRYADDSALRRRRGKVFQKKRMTCMGKRIILSADSTCDLGDALQQKYQVHYYPFHILLAGKDYQDNVDIHPEDIYQAWWERKALPKTAAINVAEYEAYFRQWVEDGFEVVHLNLGSGLSSAYQNCVQAARQLGHVYPVDSGNLSTGIGLLVLRAADMIQEGMEAAEIAKRLESLKSRVHSSFILDTLEFMRAGGRCSAVTAFGANVLGLKPCIEVQNTDGSMKVGKKYRGRLDKVLVSYVKDKLAAYPDIDQSRLFITHSGIEERYIRLVEETVRSQLSFKEIFITKASCTISCHCGPNTLGILFMT